MKQSRQTKTINIITIKCEVDETRKINIELRTGKRKRERYGRWKEFAKETQYSNKINGCNDDKKREEWKAPNADMRKNIYPH